MLLRGGGERGGPGRGESRRWPGRSQKVSDLLERLGRDESRSARRAARAAGAGLGEAAAEGGGVGGLAVENAPEERAAASSIAGRHGGGLREDCRVPCELIYQEAVCAN